MKYSLAELAEKIGATVRGNSEHCVTGLSTLSTANSEQVTFLANDKYRTQLTECTAGAVILREQDDDPSLVTNALITENPYLAFAYAAQAFDSTPIPAAGVAETAIIETGVTLDPTASIAQGAVVKSGATIGSGAIVGANSVVGEGAVIGAGTRLWPNVTVYHNCVLGEQCNVHSGTVIGSDGFGWASENGKWVKIPQLGRVIIGDQVDIGANTVIDRGALEDTVIESNVIIDNLCQIAHNVKIGSGTALAGQVGIAGSTTIGRNCMVGGQAGFAGHITIADNVQLHGQAMVTKSIESPGVYASGNPATDQSTWAKAGVRYRQLPELFTRVRALEKKLKD